MTQNKPAFICILIVNNGFAIWRDGQLFKIFCGAKFYEGNTSPYCFAPAKGPFEKKDFLKSVFLPDKTFIGKFPFMWV